MLKCKANTVVASRIACDYSRPEVSLINIDTEGVLCNSAADTNTSFKPGTSFGGDEYGSEE